MSIVLYIPKIANYLKILTDKKTKDFVTPYCIEYLNLQVKNCIQN